MKRKALFKSFNIYFSRLFGYTSFADSIHSVSDLRFHLSILLGANQLVCAFQLKVVSL